MPGVVRNACGKSFLEANTWIYNYRPRALLIAGRLDEFNAEKGVNEEKYTSFEMLRRNVNTPEIITFDELYERAKYIVEHTGKE